MGCVFLIANPVGALGSSSPFGADMSPANRAVHLLRLHYSGHVTTMNFGLYYDDPSTAGKTFRLVKPDRGCYYIGDSNANPRIRVRINGVSETKSNTAVNCNNAYGSYSIPSLNYDSSTGKYKATVVVEIEPPSGYATSWYSAGNGSNNQRHKVFHFRADATGNGVIATLNNSSKTAFGIIGDSGYGNYDVTYRIPFASESCSVDPGWRSVGIWDPDPGKYGPAYLKVQYANRGQDNWSDAPTRRISGGGNVNAINGNGYYETTSGTGTTVTIQVDMDRSHRYRLVLRDPDNSGETSSYGNVYSAFWPYDSIYSEVDCSYNLNPSVTISNTSVDPGSNFSINTLVNNVSSTNANSENTEWRITKVIYSSDVPLSSIQGRAIGDSNQGPCGAINAVVNYGASNNCINDWHYENPKVFSPGGNSFSKSDETVPDVPGRRICFVNSVKRPVSSSQISTEWRHSAMQCTMIAKRPKVQFLGSDVRVQGRIGASLSDGISGNTYGSWMEYGAFSYLGDNSIASSGGGLRGGNSLSAKESWSGLTFANTGNPYGNYGSVPKANNGAYFRNVGPTKAWVGDATEPGIYDAGTNVTLSRSEINDTGRSIIIRATGTVTITDDIIIADGLQYANAKDISQIVIVAKDINIESSVKRIDAWLIADTINTCSTKGPANLTSGAPCNEQLVVNGPVDTSRLYLNRTYGANAGDPQAAAEIFNLRPSTYMWAYNYINQQDRARTVYVTELAPRL